MARRDEDDDDHETGPEFEFSLTQGKRHGLKALVLFFGHSGSGKTFSAMRLARGLVGPNGKIGVLDTEHNRALHYANEFDFMHATMSAPFTPDRYKKAVEEFERQGVDCMIVDSMSHVQEGEGGLQDMADAEEKRLGNVGMGSQWAKPKAAWKKVRNRFLQSRMHIIFCARAKNPLEKDPDNSRKLIAGELVPIMPKGFEYEVTVSLGIDVQTHSIIPVKLPNQLAGAFPLDEYITESSGEMMRQWLDGERIVDRAFEALKQVGVEQAVKGTDALKAWFLSLDPKNRTRLKEYLDDELKPIANGDKKPPAPSASDAGRGRNDPPARGDREPASSDRRRERPPREEAPPPLPPPPASPPPPPKNAKAKDEQNEFDLDGDEGGDQEDGDEPMPPHDYPPINLGDAPNWSDVAGEIADFIEGQPDDVALIQRVYKTAIERMKTEKGGQRAWKMLESVINKAMMT